MSRKRGPEQWRRVVYRESKRAPLGCRLFLVYLSDHMDMRRIVSRPRHLVANDLGVSERAVTKYVAEAHSAGFLSTVVRGQKGITAVYQGMFPNSQGEPRVPAEKSVQGERNEPPEHDQSVPPERGFRGNHVFPPIESTGHREIPTCASCHGWGCERCVDD